MTSHQTHSFPLSPGDLTSCWRGVYYKRKKVETPSLHPDIKETLEFFRSLGQLGSAFQKYLTADWRKRGVLLASESWLPDNPWNIKGKFDAICRVDDVPSVVEIKGAGDTYYNWYQKQQAPLPSHKTQVLVYYLIMREEYDGLVPRVLYVNRKTRKSFAIDVQYTEDELTTLIDRIETLHHYLENDELPPPAPNIESHLVTGQRGVSMAALTCHYHTLCTNNPHWYEDALYEAAHVIAENDTATSI